MSVQWLMFSFLAVIGSTLYNVGVKISGPNVNPFGFFLAMTFFAFTMSGVCFVAAKYGFGVDCSRGLLTPSAIKWAALCAFGVVMTNVTYFLAMRFGSSISAQVFWAVGGMIVFSCVAVLFLNETISLTKLVGIAFGVVSVFLIAKAP